MTHKHRRQSIPVITEQQGQTRPHQIVLLTGPPGSGKDTAALFGYEHFDTVRMLKFSEPLRRTVAALFNVRIEDMEKDKDLPRPELWGRSWRARLIQVSESMIKPNFGEDFFGQQLVRIMQQPHAAELTMISDSGFVEEAIPLIAAFGGRNMHVFRLHRKGCSFDGDSRSYWKVPAVIPEKQVHDIHNDHELSMFRIQILRRIDAILGIVGKGYIA